MSGAGWSQHTVDTFPFLAMGGIHFLSETHRALFHQTVPKICVLNNEPQINIYQMGQFRVIINVKKKQQQQQPWRKSLAA